MTKYTQMYKTSFDLYKTFVSRNISDPYTVKRVDELVRHPHLVTQDQKTQVSNKFFDIPVENFTINIKLFRHFSQVSN
jgi:hypothetical protein